MIKNVKLKKILKKGVFPVFSFVNRIVPKNDNYIMMYSANEGIRHSLKPLLRYLLDNGYEKKYHIICGIEDLKYADNEHRIKYVDKFRAIFYFMRCGHIFYTTGQIPIKPAKNQCVIHLQHGNANFKSCGRTTNINNGDEFYFTYMIASSSYFVPIMQKEYGCSEKNISVQGDTLIDELLHPFYKKYDLGSYKKVLLWLPTFRQSDFCGYNDSSWESLVPLFSTVDYENLNDYLHSKNVKIIVKVHSAQKINPNQCRHFSNLSIFSNNEFNKKGYDLYTLMNQVDGLIGDYSSASLQYLIMDKPQAYVIPDITEYSEKRGFTFSNPEHFMAGHIVKSKKEFYAFIDDIVEEKDCYIEKRKEIRNIVFQYQDDKNCERIVRLSQIYL